MINAMETILELRVNRMNMKKGQPNFKVRK